MTQNLSQRTQRLTAGQGVTQLVAEFTGSGGFRKFDAVMLSMTAIESIAESGIFPDGGKQFSSRLGGRCMVLAADAVVRAVGVGPDNWFGDVRWLCRRFGAWVEGVRSVRQAIRLGGWPSDYEAKVAASYEVLRETFGPKRDPEQLVGAARQALKSLGLPAEHEDAAQTLAWFKRSKLSAQDSLFLTKDRRLGVGYRQLRDAIAAEYGGKRTKPQVDEELVYDTKTIGHDFEVKQTERRVKLQPLKKDLPLEAVPEDVDDRLDGEEQMLRLRYLLQARRNRARIGRLNQIVLDNYQDLRFGGLSIRALAKREGCSHRALQRAFDREDSGLLEGLRKKTR